jgi:hypothetical protein
MKRKTDADRKKPIGISVSPADERFLLDSYPGVSFSTAVASALAEARMWRQHLHSSDSPVPGVYARLQGG